MKPFLLFSWTRPFLPALLDHIVTCSENKLEQVVLILPNSRPRRYIVEQLGSMGYHGLLPLMLTFEECADEIMRHQGQKLCHKASLLDCVALLYRCILGPAREIPYVERHFREMALSDFWPWGLRLARLMDEFWREGREVQNILLSEDVPSEIRALCEALQKISGYYVEELNQAHLTTRARLFFSLDCEHLPDRLKGELVFVAGPGPLHGSEERLVHGLWKKGAQIALHTDPSLDHPQVRCHKKMIARFGARTERIGTDMASESTPKISFHAAYDSHSQLKRLKEDLARLPDDRGTVAILPLETSLLIPILHHLPEKNVNISLGYPLKTTLLGQFLSILFTLQERRREDGRYYWRDLLHLLTHPYVAALERSQKTEQADSDSSPKKPSPLFSVTCAVRLGNRYQDLSELEASLEPASRTLLRHLSELCLSPLENPPHLAALATHLQTLTLSLRDSCLLSPIEAEAMVRFQEQVLPALADSLIAHEPFSLPLQKKILRELVESENIPFEADPLTAVQILGLFETGLLQFDHIFILDADDDLLPGSNRPDLLLPDKARREAGLKSLEERQEESGYNLFRLISCAKEVTFCWQEGAGLGPDAGKKSRSRFVEQLIWEEEQRQKKVLTFDQAPLSMAKVSVCPHRPTPSKFCSNAVTALSIRRLLARGLSATALDSFLRCPLAFARSYLLGLAPEREPDEGEARNVAGDIVHKILHQLYARYQGQTIEHGAISRGELTQALEACFTPSDLGNLPSVSYFVLKEAILRLVGDYLACEPTTTILELEQHVRRTVTVDTVPCVLHGFVDRLDLRQGELLLIDYKTGKLKLPPEEFWMKSDLWLRLEAAHDDTSELNGLLAELSKLIPSIQLPFYLVLLQEHCQKLYGKPPANAVLIQLAYGGQSYPLFGEEIEPETCANLSEKLIFFLIHALLKLEDFRANPGDYCGYCSFAGLCQLSCPEG